MCSSHTGSCSGSVVNILTENQIPIFSDGYHASGNQNSISMFLLANSIPLAKSACKAPAQVSDHLFQAASSILQHSPIEGVPDSLGKIRRGAPALNTAQSSMLSGLNKTVTEPAILVHSTSAQCAGGVEIPPKSSPCDQRTKKLQVSSCRHVPLWFL